ncbi:hypothetical protein M422DRAFT_258368 [Sphaerobolus stellatus SS14]|uniref:Uncharacterized protein n=1 Tax=Sphaerobolus stellatus (strain SS14) TaxID=990650 RepID=A0A0C9VBP4_SPHS4|nr:hypothetical protein M422DRAFT_258368 [Sphaerobolus stellatus SS14]
MSTSQPQMREHARRSSGIYDQESPFSGGSQEGLAAQAQPPAGFVPANAQTGTAVVSQQPRTPFYKTKKFIICQIIAICLAIVILFVLLFPVVRAVAQLVVNRSQLVINAAQITSPQNGTFGLNLTGLVTNTGIFSATIHFTKPINVGWVQTLGSSPLPLGSMSLDSLSAKHHRAELNQATTFTITNESNFGLFTAALITDKNFTWHLESNDLRVNAMKFPVAKGIKFKKDVLLNGINNFDGQVKLVNFELPADSPDGGIKFTATTELNNPSPFNVDLGFAVFNLTYKGLYLGQGESTQSQISPGGNNITLNGRLIEQTGAENLAIIGELFSNYLNSEPGTTVIATGVSTHQQDGGDISWLSQGLQSLNLNVPFIPAVPVNPIQAIDIGFLNMTFTPESAYTPMTSSDSVFAALKLPFGFNLNISQIANSFAIMQNDVIVGNLTTSFGESSSDINVLGPKDTEGSINITLNNSPLRVPDNGHATFNSFAIALTSSDEVEFNLVGHADANSDLAIGAVTLNPIKFSVPSKLKGLKGLKGSTTINTVDVTGGTSDHIDLAIDVTIVNPSALNLNTGDLTLQLLRNGEIIGTTLLSNLSLAMGTNKLAATGKFTPNLNSQGQQTLNDFIGGKDVPITIAGFDGSTQVASLLDAFKTLNIDATLPALNSSLLETASLQILSTTGVTNHIAHVTVALANPFTGGLTITGINSTVTSHGLTLGTINTDTNFAAEGKKTTASPTLDFDMNLDPPVIFTLLRRLAVQAGQDTTQIDAIVALGDITYVASTDADNDHINTKRADASTFANFDLPTFVDKAFTQLQSDIELTSAVSIGDYATSLQFTQSSVPVKTDDSLHMLLPILAQPIVQKIITGAELSIDTVIISNPQQNSFVTALKGSITNAGPFDAEIDFGAGLTISFAGQPLGTIQMPKVQLKGDVGAPLDVTATFNVADVDRLTAFTKVLLTEESFTWDISGSNLTVNALGISVPSVALTTKSVNLKGMNGLKGGVTIDSFDLPANDPAGGVHLTLQTTVTNPSQVGVELSSLSFNNFVGSTLLGPAAASDTFTLAPQSTFKLPLVGRLVKQDSDSGLAAVSQVFTDFIHGKDTAVTVVGASAGPSDVTWLNNAITSLNISAVLPSQGKLNVIKSINLDQLELDFTKDTAYNPATSSNAATAAFQIPFAFPIDIVGLSQDITASINGESFATLNIPKGPSITDVDSRIIHLSFSNVPFAVAGDKHSVFQQFLTDTTKSKSETFRLAGAANTDASTAIGVLSLTDIEFDVETTIQGLQDLNAKPAVVSNLDVNQGFSDYLLIKVTTTLNNPSNLTISTGDVAFGLNFNDANIGTANIANLKIIPGDGNYSTDVHFQPQGSAVSNGQLLLENFLQGVNSNTVIVGTSSTTQVDSLIPALEQITLNANIPALHQNLITATNIVFPLNILSTGIAAVTVNLANPFTASINILVLQATASFGGVTLGTVPKVDASASPVHAAGHSNITTPSLPLAFNLDPTAIITLISTRAAQKSIDVGPLAQLFPLALAHPTAGQGIVATVVTNGTTCNSGNQFDVASAILKALEGLEVTLDVQTTLKLDEYQTDLSFKQYNVPAVTGQTALFLIGAVAPPIVQLVVSSSVLSFDVANITNISDEGFDISLHGSLLDTGPLDALITFVDPLNVNWQGKDIATIVLPSVCAAANVGVPNYETQGRLTITNLDAFTEFATFLLHNPTFDWTISTDKLRLNALGTNFDNVKLSKTVTFKAFNGLPGVTVSNFQLPADNQAGGITISTDSDIPSPAAIGIQLGTVSFTASFNGVDLGPLTGTGLFLGAGATTKTHLDGRITPQSGDNLKTIGELFSNFLAGKNQTLIVKGSSVDPNGNNKAVSWLSTAFKTLSLNVTLPGKVFEVIHSINIQDLELQLVNDDQDYAPSTSSKSTVATFSNPFGFSLQVVEAGQDLTINFNGQDAASLTLPVVAASSGVSTGDNADLVLSFSKLTLKSLNNAAFGSFFAEVTDKQSAAVILKGAANIVAKTSIGNVPISGIPFNVPSTIGGINSFNGQASLSNVSIAGSGGTNGNQYIRTPLVTTLQNPSNITLNTNGISLPVFYNSVSIGRAVIDKFDLVPGANVIPSEFHYMPANSNDTTAQSFLSKFLVSSDTLDLTIKGDSASSTFNSLAPAFEGVSLSASLKGNGVLLITNVLVTITLDTLITGLIALNFDVFNPTQAPLVIKHVQSNGMLNGITYAFFSHDFDDFVVPPFKTANSGDISNILLTQGVDSSLDIIPVGLLDIGAAQTVLVGEGGYEIPWLQVSQPNVPTQYVLDLGFAAKISSAVMAEAVSKMSPKVIAFASSHGIQLPTVSNTTSSSVTSSKESSTVATSATAATSNTAAQASETASETKTTVSADAKSAAPASSTQEASSTPAASSVAASSTPSVTGEKIASA